MFNVSRAFIYGSFFLMAVGTQLPLAADSYGDDHTSDRSDLNDMRNRSRNPQNRYQTNYNYYGSQPYNYNQYQYPSGYGYNNYGYGNGYGNSYGYYTSPPPPTPNQAFPDDAAANDLYRYLQSR